MGLGDVRLGYGVLMFFFFFQAEDGIRDSWGFVVVDWQTFALPISRLQHY